MSLMPFHSVFPDEAAAETRVLTVFKRSGPGELPPDDYGFDEWYCAERGCDCRRVLVRVLARQGRAHVATISHAFEAPGPNAALPGQTFLDPLNPQSDLAPLLLHAFIHRVLADEAYRQRLERHYRMFKEAVEDPSHPKHRVLSGGAG